MARSPKLSTTSGDCSAREFGRLEKTTVLEWHDVCFYKRMNIDDGSRESKWSLLVYRRGQHTKRGFIVPDRGAIQLGRSSSADVVLDDPRVSRLHAELRSDGGWLRVTDLGSANGIRFGDSVAGTVLLGHDDWIDIGPFRIQVAHSEVAETSVMPTDSTQAEILLPLISSDDPSLLGELPPAG